jgi:hypothetical protein
VWKIKISNLSTLLLLKLLMVALLPASAAPGSISRVSVKSNGAEGNDDSYYAVISGNGRFVTFASFATCLIAGDTNNRLDVFVYDRQTGETTRVSVVSGGGEGNRDSSEPAI